MVSQQLYYNIVFLFRQFKKFSFIFALFIKGLFEIFVYLRKYDFKWKTTFAGLSESKI